MSSSAVLGQYLWHELLTTDPDAGAGFYAKVLGWNRFPYEGDPGYAPHLDRDNDGVACE